MPWCSGPTAPGWNVSLPGGGCASAAIADVGVRQNAAVSELCPYFAFTRPLRFGSTGEDVRALQKFLNCAGFPLSSSGPGSAGFETPNFASRTLKAMDAFQAAYVEDILAPVGAEKPTGIFATFSQKKTYSLMQAQ
jgi:peptidoglycan hydrolase-like protein with peptidoglycan-binding domain